MFAYCSNNPVNKVDPDGDLAFLIPIFATAPSWVPVVAGVTTAIIGGICVGTTISEARKHSDSKPKEEKKAKARSKNPPAKRKDYKSKKSAYEAAKKAGKGKEPTHHPDGEYGPHYHPDVPQPREWTPKGSSPHDHYYY